MTATTAQHKVNTKTVNGHRTLRFKSAADVLNDAEKLAAAERAGTLRHLGNWSLGTAFNHLAAWIDYEYDGYPKEFKVPPRILCFIARVFMKKRFLYSPMPRGWKIPKIETGTFATQETGLEEGLSTLRRSWQRLESTPCTVPHPIFGPLTHEEWIAMHLRHAELHLGYYDVR